MSEVVDTARNKHTTLECFLGSFRINGCLWIQKAQSLHRGSEIGIWILITFVSMLHSHWFVWEDLQQGLILFILVCGSVNIHQMLGFFRLHDQLHAKKRAYFTILESKWLASGFSTITARIWWEAEGFAESNAESLPAVVIAEEGLHNVMKWEEAEPWG